METTMSPRRKGIGTISLVIVVIVIILIGIVAFVLYSPTETSTTTYSTSVTGTSTTTYSTSVTDTTTDVVNPANSLQLQLALNASSSSATGVSASVFVDAYNPLSSTLNVTAANTWALPLNGYNGAICGDDGPTVGFAITQGHYTSSNITTTSFLDLVNPTVTYSCSLYFGYANPIGFHFQPLSDMAAPYGCIGNACMSGTASTGGQVTGYWNQGGTFTSFPRGVYTVIAEDEWGDSVLAYFTVS